MEAAGFSWPLEVPYAVLDDMLYATELIELVSIPPCLAACNSQLSYRRTQSSLGWSSSRRVPGAQCRLVAAWSPSAGVRKSAPMTGVRSLNPCLPAVRPLQAGAPS